MNKEELYKILPHRESMMLLDEANVLDNKAFGKKKINGDEWFLNGHFPNNPIVPGVILCEIMAQSACILLKNEKSDEIETYLTGLDKVKFKNKVKPNDIFETVCEITRVKGPFYFANGKGYVDGVLCVSCEFSFAVMRKK